MLSRWSCQKVFHCFKVLIANESARWNHYKSLGLTPSASLTDIKTAYYRLSKIHHPDRNNGSATSAQKFRDIVSAYEVLSKSDSRKKYDKEIFQVFERKTAEFMPRKKGNKKKEKEN